MRLIDADELKPDLLIDGRPKYGIVLSLETIEFVIDEQPTVTEWIPVSERLPEYDEIVLLKIKDGEDYWYDNVVTGKRRKANEFIPQREEYITTGMIVHELDDVIAWMPIPEYKEGV